MERTKHAFSAGSGSPATAPAALRGRGAVTNVRHRFEQTEREPADDGWSSGQVAASQDDVSDADIAGGYIPIVPESTLKTTVTSEQARKLLSRNDSPDIPFDVAVNPYRGCEHGCVYCYARPTHAYLGYSPGLDFETRLIAKANAVDVLRAELARPGYRVSPINIGSATDVYQPIEREWQLTRGVLELLLQTRHPATIVTKNALIERDLDLLQPLAEQRLITVYISVTTLDTEMARTLEPRASAPWRRIQAIRTLTNAGVPVGVLVAPIIPFINDESLEHILQDARQAGACYASYTVVRLPWEVKAVFQEWLEAHFPDRAQRVLHRIEDMRNGRRNDPQFGTRMRGTGLWANLLRQRFNLAVRKLGLNTTRPQLVTHLFQAPRAVSPASSASAASVAGQSSSRQSRSSSPLSSSPQLALF
ncbi:PA0069 family radical SAM protein [Bordetella genomosp. 4]|uniref:Radical SAM protein n=1 Tax=Bordetella genomosp. 4 TaxID=463044 RepID=A0A261U6B0_9BORD|nr:PA0069 family radical SAM protein [Bordetella genomosp. 4]OZI57468.1 radical SAM protein [Bordetella genomosp. 4]